MSNPSGPAPPGAAGPGGRPQAALYAPIPPLATGVATYAARVLEYTREAIDWIVRYPQGGDPSSLPGDVRAVPISQGLPHPARRFFMIGNSPECYPVAEALLEIGGCCVFHDTVMHHAIRFCTLGRGRLDEYRRFLRFDYGPDAERVEDELSRKAPPEEYDRLLKSRPLLGRLLHASSGVVCLNEHAAGLLSPRVPGRRVTVISHPLSPVPDLPPLPRPQGSPVIGMAGTGHPGRNPGIFLEAVRRFRNRFPGAVAVLAGEGWDLRLPEWATCTGRLEEPQYQAWIRLMDLVVDIRHPDCGETSGSLLEAMRAGKPCIVTAAGSFLHLPSDSVLRIPAPPTEAALAAAVEMLARDGELSASLGTAAASYASSQGSPERARAEWSRLASLHPRAPAHADRPRAASAAAAWNEPPKGFTRVAAPGGPVSWTFEGRACIEGPAGSSAALVTVSGRGTASGVPLPASPAVLRIEGGRLELEGSGELVQVTWL